MLNEVPIMLLNHIHSVNEILDFVLTRFIEQKGFQIGVIVQYEQKTGRVSHYINHNLPGQIIPKIEKLTISDILKLTDDPEKTVFIHQMSVQTNRRLKTVLEPLLYHKINTGLTLFFKTSQKIWGALHLWGKEKVNVQRDDLIQYDILCSILGLALENHWLNKQNKSTFNNSDKEHIMLNAIIAKIKEAKDLKGVLSDTLKETLELLNLKVGGIYLIDELEQNAELITHSGIPTEIIHKIENLHLKNPSVSSVINASKSLITVELPGQNHELASLQDEYGFKRIVSVPLRVRDNILGFVNLSVPPLRNFSIKEMNFLDLLSKHLGNKVANLRIGMSPENSLPEMATI